jgi:FlaA1/EpsC-like NDP-sugar epimerase
VSGARLLRLVPDLERLDTAQLLGRPEVQIDCSAAAPVLQGRRVLVTGAGGSVGVPLVERLLTFQPAALVLLDNHEDSLARLERRLRGAEPAPRFVLGDIRNRTKLAALFHAHRPEVVFHLAAYKHVHLGEAYPDEPIGVNVLGTYALTELAVATDVAVFVYASSDKAVNPPGVYGATKRLAELVVRWGSRRAAGRFVIVRFVNVLGTRGSVIEIFLEQLLAGQPLTVTDPAMQRYWMSMREAVDLLLGAAASGPAGATLLIDPGAPVRVLDMAERLWALLGRPGPRPPVLYLGQRAGERLVEELVGADERLVPGPVAGLWRVEQPAAECQLAAVPERVAALAAALDRDDPTLVAQLMAFARGER